MQADIPPRPWYKETWFWLILAPLIAAVLYTPVFIYFAITTNDGLVKDNYYKVARGINLNTGPEEQARALGINGELRIDDATGSVQLTLNGNTTLPEFLDLTIVHPTSQNYDQNLKLRKLSGSNIFSGALQRHLNGKRYLLLAPEDKSWQLQAVLNPPYEHHTFSLGNLPNGG